MEVYNVNMKFASFSSEHQKPPLGSKKAARAPTSTTGLNHANHPRAK
jgi:hypothetical protein